MDELEIKVTALDKPFGYTVLVVGNANNTGTVLNEHYSTEPEVKVRLAQVWQAWANQVDAEV